MARRPTYPSKEPATKPPDVLTAEQLRQMRRSLDLLSPHMVKAKYHAVLDRCRFYDLATPRMMQELVTLWKTLWRWRK